YELLPASPPVPVHVVSVPHVRPHLPSAHTSPLAHVLPHTPQLALSVFTLKQPVPPTVVEQ
ncbi:MAG: hypothetical protein HY303_01105, partial [Candidatus Wallbacteria bacterium]|nr:hypothetical protein [Candidatus Wallbacteria bacterium]